MANKRNLKGKKKLQFNMPGGRHSVSKKKYDEKMRKKWKKTLKTHVSYSAFCVRAKKTGLKYVLSRIAVKKAKQYKCLKNKDNSKIYIHSVENNIDGSRILNVDMLKASFVEITAHTALCHGAQQKVLNNEPAIKIENEIRKGLYCLLVAKCNGCEATFQIENSENFVEGEKVIGKDINVRAVWGSMVTGGGCSSLNECLGTMGVPGMLERDYSAIETEIGNLWQSVLEEEMLLAGEEERKLALENDELHDGVPAITVICDGGWSKRTHKHSYNAMAGVGVIFGARTKKLLHIGIKNKLCYICSRAQTKNIEPVPHICFKNWNESSQSMESEIILDGFLVCEKKYGVRYMNVIADGDSSVYTNIIRMVPVWGPYVKKIECANHATKCLRSNLEKLIVDKPLYKGRGQLTKVNIRRITTGVRCAIKMRSGEKDRKNAIKKLKEDIKNTGRHVLGRHNLCSTDFCKYKKINTDNNEDDKDCAASEEDEEDDVIINQCEYWADIKDISDEEMSHVRTGGKSQLDVSESLLKDLFILLSRLAEKADRLIGNFTSNLAESWMHIRCKFDGGKMYNKCFRGSFFARCFGGALRSVMGPAWSPHVYRKITNKIPDSVYIGTYRSRSQKYINSKKSGKKVENRTKKMKRKLETQKCTATKKAKRDYGPDVLIDTDDVSKDELERQCKMFYDTNVCLNEKDIEILETETTGQSNNKKWHEERRKRVTSSVFGDIMSRSRNNNSTTLVKRLLYSTFRGNTYTRQGIREEENARLEYVNMKNKNSKNIISVVIPGLIVDKKYPFLASSSDGIVVGNRGQEGIIEIKNLLQTKPYMIEHAARNDKTFCLGINEQKISLKKTHKYYFQVQGQLNILDLPWCDFIVRRINPYDMCIERIFVDKTLWTEKMVPKLKCFYFTHILPELALPRKGTVSGIRKPSLPWFDDAQTNTVSKKVTRKLSYPGNQIDTVSATKTVTRNVRKGLIKQPSSTPSSAYSADSQTSTSHTPSTIVKRRKKVKFVGRRILHKWEEEDGKECWYSGIVLSVIKGSDGDDKAVYQVFYDKDEETYDIDSLHLDYSEGTLKFNDI